MAAPQSQDGDAELHDQSLDHGNSEAQPQPSSNARFPTSATMNFDTYPYLGLDSSIYEEIKNESSKEFGKVFFLGCFGLNENNETQIYDWSVLLKDSATSLRELSHSIHRAAVLMMDEANHLNNGRCRFTLSCVASDPDRSNHIFSYNTLLRRADVAWKPKVFAARLILKMLGLYGHLKEHHLNHLIYDIEFKIKTDITQRHFCGELLSDPRDLSAVTSTAWSNSGHFSFQYASPFAKYRWLDFYIWRRYTFQRRNTVWLAWEPDRTYPRASIVVSSIKMLAKIRDGTKMPIDGTYQPSELNYDARVFASLVSGLFFSANSSAIEFLESSFRQINNIRTKARYYTGRSKYVYLTELREAIVNNRDDLAVTRKTLPIWANSACAEGWSRIGDTVLSDLEYVERKMNDLHEFVLEIANEVKSLHEFHYGQFAMALTVLAIIYVPFGAVTSFYGANASEFVDGAHTHIKTVWKVAVSVTLGSLALPLFGLLALSSVVYATQQGILMTILDWPGLTKRCFYLLVTAMLIVHSVSTMHTMSREFKQSKQGPSMSKLLSNFFRKCSQFECVVVNAVLAILEIAMAAQVKIRFPRNRSYLVWIAGSVTAGVCSGLSVIDHTEITLLVPWIVPLCLAVLCSLEPIIPRPLNRYYRVFQGR